MGTTTENVHIGHRARMLDKFDRYGARVFDSYELLEMLLYRVIPYRDTNPVAHRLFDRFGSLDGIFCATEEELCSVNGVGPAVAAFLMSVGEAGAAALRMHEEAPTFDDYHRAGRYFANLLGSEPKPRTVMLMLDNRMQLIGKREIADLDFGSAGIRVPLIVEPAIRSGASVILLAHNHPYGPLYPSEADQVTNSLIRHALNDVSIHFAEHYIVCGSEYLGFCDHMDLVCQDNQVLSHFDHTREGGDECHDVASL